MKTAIKVLIWTYIVLLLVEGAFRKWFFPSLSDQLLVVRDPVLLVIYALALPAGYFPNNRFIVALVVLAALSVAAFVFGGHNHYLVLAYGLRINYLHLPLIWIMGRVLTVRDVQRMGAFLLLVAIPMTVIMVEQFRAPMNAWINRGVGNDEVGQIFGADGRIRPPGLFAFITGPQLYFPLCAAFFFDEISGGKRLPWYLIIGSGLAIAVALPISISRTVMLGTALVAGVFMATLPLVSARFSSIVRPIFLLIIVVGGLSQLPIFRQSIDVFMIRWDTAAGGEGSNGAWSSILDRSVNGFLTPYYFMKEAPLLGHGIGMGSNVGARLTSGNVGFMLAEEEWGKVILELGPVLGVAFIGFRFVLLIWLALKSWRALRHHRHVLPILIFTAIGFNVLQGQWAPPTILGFCVVGAGLLLGALNPVPTTSGSGGAHDSAAPRHPEPRVRTQVPLPSDRRLPVVLRPDPTTGAAPGKGDRGGEKISVPVRLISAAAARLESILSPVSESDSAAAGSGKCSVSLSVSR